MHEGSRIHRDQGFRSRRAIAEGAVWADGVVVDAPLLYDDLGLADGVEDLAVEQFVPEPRVEALNVAVFPWRARLDVGGPGADRCDPVPDRGRDELGTVVRPDVLRWPPEDEEIDQRVEDIGRVELACNMDHERLPGELIEDDEDAIGSAVVGAILDEVIGPDMVRPLRPEPDAGAIVQPEPAPLLLLRWNLQPFAPPDTLDPLVVHVPARMVQQRRHRPVAVTAILGGPAPSALQWDAMSFRPMGRAAARPVLRVST